ncbi:MAG: Rne/Rng family ribonuclease [Pseudomonadota bacterium]
MSKKMLIDATHPEETRVVVVDGNKVDDFDFETVTKRQLAGNIYLAKVTRVEPSLQAAFVEYGGNRHGFLAFSEIHPDYYQIPVADREALLAEEEALAREGHGNGDTVETKSDGGAKRGTKGTGRSRRGGRKSAAEKPEAAEVAAEAETQAEEPAGPPVKGLEVIEPDGGALAIEDEPSIPEPVDTRADAEMAAEPAQDAQAETSDADALAPKPDAEMPVDPDSATEEASSAKAQEPEPQTDTTEVEPAQGGSNRSIAEAAGLGDDDAVSEEIPSELRAKRAEPAPASDTAPTAAPEETAAEGPASSPAAEASDHAEKVAEETAAAAPEAPAELAEEAPDDQGAATALGEGETADIAAETQASPSAGAEADTPKPRRNRRRKSSKKRGDEAEAEPAAPAKAKDTDNRANGDEAEHSESESEVESVGAEDVGEDIARIRAQRRRRYKIQDVVKVRQIMLVQVVKEERGNKGAALTTYLSLAGRYCVLMPNTARGGGISRKITQASDRKRLREIVGELEVPKGMGLIVRTAGAERTRAEIKRDYEFLLRQWEQIRELTLKSVAPTLIYEEGSLIKRSIRDLYSKDIESIQVEGEVGYREAKDYMKMLMPSHAKNVQQYADQIPLFIRYQVESYLNGMFSPVVQLKSGGYIVIGITEALVAIDVNSGRSTREGSVEDTAVKTNLEAADEVARQLRLRDLAGLIVIDFIDMEDNRNNRAVEKRMKDRLKVDRARIQVGRISAFGLMEMSRQRLRPGMLEATTQPCPHCQGTGIIRSDESMSLAILREVEEEGVRGRSAEVRVAAPVSIANYIVNHKRAHVARIEERYGMSVVIMGDPLLVSPSYRVERSKTPPKGQSVVEGDVITATTSAETKADVEEAQADAPDAIEDEGRDGKARRRRGKRGGRRRRGDGREDEATEAIETQEEGPPESEEASAGEEDDGAKSSRKRRRRRRGRGKDGEAEATADVAGGMDTVATDLAAEDDGAETQFSDSAGDPAQPVSAVDEAPLPDDAPPPAMNGAAAEAAMAPEPIEVAEAQHGGIGAEIEETDAPTDASDGERAQVQATPSDDAEGAPATAIDDAAPVEAGELPQSADTPDDGKPKRRGWWAFGL